LNGDGDYVDPGEVLPLPARLPLDYGGKETVIAVPDTTQPIRDFVAEEGGDFIGVVLGPGKLRGSGGAPGEDVRASYRTLRSQGASLPRVEASYEFERGTPRRALSLFGF